MDTKATSVTVELEYPVEFEGETISSLTFRRMRAGDALVTEKETSQIKANWALLGLLSGKPPALFEMLDVDDRDAIEDKVTPLMGKRMVAMVKAQRQMIERLTHLSASSPGATDS